MEIVRKKLGNWRAKGGKKREIRRKEGKRVEKRGNLSREK